MRAIREKQIFILFTELKNTGLLTKTKKTLEVYTLIDEGFKLYQEYKVDKVLKSLVLEGFESDLKEVFIFKNRPL
jgi:hypothetical protein